MLRNTIIIATLAAALATPAFARQVTISLKGKTSDAIAAEVAVAAQKVCKDVFATPLAPDARTLCVKDTIAKTHEKIAAAGFGATTLASR
jgi:hypothetical protein